MNCCFHPYVVFTLKLNEGHLYSHVTCNQLFFCDPHKPCGCIISGTAAQKCADSSSISGNYFQMFPPPLFITMSKGFLLASPIALIYYYIIAVLPPLQSAIRNWNTAPRCSLEWYWENSMLKCVLLFEHLTPHTDFIILINLQPTVHFLCLKRHAVSCGLHPAAQPKHFPMPIMRLGSCCTMPLMCDLHQEKKKKKKAWGCKEVFLNDHTPFVRVLCYERSKFIAWAIIKLIVFKIWRWQNVRVRPVRRCNCYIYEYSGYSRSSFFLWSYSRVWFDSFVPCP